MEIVNWRELQTLVKGLAILENVLTGASLAEVEPYLVIDQEARRALYERLDQALIKAIGQAHREDCDDKLRSVGYDKTD